MDIKLFLIFCFVFFLLAESSDALMCGIYFTDNNSPDCKIIDDFIDSQKDLHEDLTLITYDLSKNENVEIGNEFLRQYFLSEPYNFPESAPFILFGEDKYLAGVDEIKECLSLKMKLFTEHGGNPCPFLSYPEYANENSGDGFDKENPGGKGEIVGDPEIKLIIQNPENPDAYNRNESESVGMVNEEELKTSKDAIERKIRDDEIKESEEIFFENLPYIYIAFLGAVIAIAFIVYIRKLK